MIRDHQHLMALLVILVLEVSLDPEDHLVQQDHQVSKYPLVPCWVVHRKVCSVFGL